MRPGERTDPPAFAVLSGTASWIERVAQSVEHLTFNQGVPGSSPGALTNEIKKLVEFPKALKICADP
jgi:hypothetical protein